MKIMTKIFKYRVLVVIIIFVTIFSIHSSINATSSQLIWSSLEDSIPFEELIIQDGGTYSAPFGVVRNARVESDVTIGGTEGYLYFINSETSTREQVIHIGGNSGTNQFAWEQSGIYELDVYDAAIFPVRSPLWKNFFAWLFPSVAHAQSEETFIETIRFAIEEETGVFECCSSVVFLPGIKGSVLKTGSDTLWPPTIFSDDMTQLAIDESGESVNDIYVDGILDTFYGTSIYAPFSEFMNSIVFEGVMNAWLPLPYDWRFSPEKILEDGVKTESDMIDLIEEIENLAAQSQTGQVTIIAHSMGGLMGKAIIKKLEEMGKDNLIDSFVMVGTPQLGTPQAAATLLHGDDEGIVAGFIVGPITARKIAQNMPSAYNLLTSPRYFEEVTDPVILFDPNASFTQVWRDFWGEEINTYNNFLSFVTGTGVFRAKPEEDLLRVPEVLRSDLAADAADFHNKYDNYIFPNNIRVVQVAGWGRPTTKAIEYRNNHFLPSYRTLFTTEGDKTVVYPSAVSSVADESYFFDLYAYNNEDNSNFQHRDLLSSPPIQNVLKVVIKEGNILTSSFIRPTKPEPGSITDQLVVSAHSPVILGAYDRFDNFTGINPNQDLSADILLITENIPGSTFLYTTESQYIFLPKTGVYHFVYKGIDEGPTTVEIGNFVVDTVTPVANYSDIPTTQNTITTFVVDSTAPEETVIKIDVDSDGEIDETISPDGTALSLNKLIVLIKEKIQTLDVRDRLKKNLLEKIENLEKKIRKKKEKNAKILAKLEQKITKEEARGKIDAADANEIIKLLDMLEAQVEDAVLDADILLELKDKIQSLDIKNGLKNSLLKRAEKLENKQALIRTLSNLTKNFLKKGEKGRIDDSDVQEIIGLIKQIENAL